MEQLKHECGVAMIRLLKPLEYYEEKYGTWMYGLNKLYLLMEKQHNRGQEGAGLACVKLEASPGEEYMFRERALGSGAITEIFGTVQGHFKDLTKEQLHDADYAKRVLPFAGEVYMGHLRYSTTGKSGISYVHPFLRRNNWRAIIDEPGVSLKTVRWGGTLLPKAIGRAMEWPDSCLRRTL